MRLFGERHAPVGDGEPTYHRRMFLLRIGNGRTGRTPYPAIPGGMLGILIARMPGTWREVSIR